MFRKQWRNPNGFTLIELLVVMAIIGILVSATTVLTNKTRIYANDSHRLAGLQQLTLALQVYYADHGRYPAPSGRSTYVADIVGLVPRYIPELPVDPKHTGTRRYRYNSSDYTKGYTILVNMERDQIPWCRLNVGQPGSVAWDSTYPLCK